MPHFHVRPHLHIHLRLGYPYRGSRPISAAGWLAMKVLFLAHLFPLPLDSGGKIKSYYTLKTLAKEHQVHTLAYVRREQERGLVDELKAICADVDVVPLSRSALRRISDAVSGLLSRRSFIVSRDFRREMQEAVTRIVRDVRPDAIHIDHLQMAQFVDFSLPGKRVLDNHNVESLIVKRVAETSTSPLTRLYASIEWPKLARYELDACRKCDIVLTVSEEDAETLRAMDGSLGNVRTVPIGVDVEYFRPVERNRSSRNILSIGTMYWPPNVDAMLYFHREILPIIRERFPDCTLTIAGQGPAKAVTSLAADSAVKVTGYVEDVREIARNCGVFVVPLRSGSGVRVKILNALAMGLPVVSTSIGAEGLDVKDRQHLLIADSPQEFAEAVSKLFQDSELACRLGRNGRRLACEKYSWDVVGERLLRVYETELGSGGSPQ